MGDVEQIKAAISDLSSDVKSSLKDVNVSLSDIQQTQAQFGVKIDALEKNSDSFRGSLDRIIEKVTKAEVKLEDIDNDTQQQWDHITAIKDAVRTAPAPKSNGNGGFWDKDTKKLGLKVGGTLLAIVMVLLAGQSESFKHLVGLF